MRFERRSSVLCCSGVNSAALVLTPACTKSSSGSEPATPASSQPDHNAPLTEAPVPPPVTANPLKGAKLFVDPESNAMLKARFLRKTDPAKADLLDKIAKEPQGLWMGEWNSNIYRAVDHFVERAMKDGSVAVIIAYNIPHRDAAAEAAGVGASAGGLASKEKYQRWIRDVYAGTANRPVAIVLEPDALPGVTSLPADLQEERYFLFNDAVKLEEAAQRKQQVQRRDSKERHEEERQRPHCTVARKRSTSGMSNGPMQVHARPSVCRRPDRSPRTIG